MKKPLIVSLIIMTLALAVAVVGVSAAWFADIKSVTNVIQISSDKPEGQASIDVTSAEKAYPLAGELCPAVIKPELMLGDGAGAGIGGVPFDKIDVLDENSAGEGDTLPLLSTASKVKIVFPFLYIGSPDNSDGTKGVTVSFMSATLENPRADENTGKTLADYKNNFDFYNFRVLNEKPDSENLPEFVRDETADAINDNEKFINVVPGVTYYFYATIYFNKVDEECDPILMNTTIYFNFSISA